MRSLAQTIPVRVRRVVYSVIGTLFGVEMVLDGFGSGLVSEQVQGVVFGVLGVLGFSTAVLNTPLPVVGPDDDGLVV